MSDDILKHFEIAYLIFISRNHLDISYKSLDTIKERFTEILSSLQGTFEQDSRSNIKNSNMFPYHSMSPLGPLNKYTFLYCATSFNNPILYAYNVATGKVRNFLDVNDAKGILNDEIYTDIKSDLRYPRHLNNYLLGVKDINTFVKNYQKILEFTNKGQKLEEKKLFESYASQIEKPK